MHCFKSFLAEAALGFSFDFTPLDLKDVYELSVDNSPKHQGKKLLSLKWSSISILCIKQETLFQPVNQ